MTILSAQSIRRAHNSRDVQLIEPFHDRTITHGMSYGLSAAGYDVRVAENLRIERGGFVLASTIERFNIPRDLLGMVADKSSWARRGLALQHTVIEPGWRGYLTIELSNHGPETIVIKAGMPIAQIIFHRLDEPTNQPYSGKYMDQPSGPQKARDEPELPLSDAWRIGPIDDDMTAIYRGNERVGYVDENHDLYAIGSDNAAHWVAGVTDRTEILTQLKRWFNAQYGWKI